LLDDAYIGHELSSALIFADFAYFGQAALEVVTSVAHVQLGLDINHIPGPQFRHPSGIAFGLQLAEADFAGAGFFGSVENATSFEARELLIFFVHLEPAAGK